MKFFQLIKKNIKNSLLVNTYFICFLAYFVHKFICEIKNVFPKDSWNLSEWLINYQGGFVRRGLRGEIIFQLYSKFGLEPHFVIKVFTVCFFVLLSAFFIKQFIKKGYSLFPLPLVFFLGMPIIHGIWLRIDCLLALCFIGIIYLLWNRPRLYIFWVNFLFIFAVLIHEAFILYTLPIVFLSLLYLQKNSKQHFYSYFRSIIYLLPVFSVFIFVLIHHGTTDIPYIIWQSWDSVPFPDGSAASLDSFDISLHPITALSLSFREGFTLYTGKFLKLFDGHFVLYGPLMVALTFIGVYYIIINIGKLNDSILIFKSGHGNKYLISTVFLFGFISIFPLIIMGCDYGRWIFIWVTSSFTLLLIIPEEQLENIYPQILKSVSSRLVNIFDRIFGSSKSTIYLLCAIIGIPMSNWALPEAVLSSSLFLILIKFSGFINAAISF